MLKSNRGGQRKGSGRPKSPNPMRTYSIRFTDAERTIVEQKAKESNLTLSEYIRQKSLQ